MFFKKKSTTISETNQDRLIKRLSEEKFEAMQTLCDRVENVIVSEGVIALYPEGADKEKAKHDCELQKKMMLASIGHYDSIRNDYIEACMTDSLRISTAGWRSSSKTSHEIIEECYKNFYKRG